MTPTPAFVDSAKISVEAGNGGDGCCSFRKDRLSRYPRPDGGSGGRGGDVRVCADENVSTLLDLQYRKQYKAQDGGAGGPNNRTGEKGEDRIIAVPVGTEVLDKKRNLIADLIKNGREVVVARGGSGGRGNYNLKGYESRTKKKGERGEGLEITLELKLLAEVGVVGYPNAGKSSFVSRVTGAHIKVADYPFTTKNPHIGIVRDGEGRGYAMADIPGLIEGAHRGKGLGTRFLRHIERTKILLHIVDMSGRGGVPEENYRSLNAELKLYGHNLPEKPQVIAANKMDQPGSAGNLVKFKKEIKSNVYPISCLTGEGIGELLSALKDETVKY